MRLCLAKAFVSLIRTRLCLAELRVCPSAFLLYLAGPAVHLAERPVSWLRPVVRLRVSFVRVWELPVEHENLKLEHLVVDNRRVRRLSVLNDWLRYGICGRPRAKPF